MVGITNIYPYIPKNRMNTKSIKEAWGKNGKAKYISFSNYDEDAITLGVNTLANQKLSTNDINFLFFATTSNPFVEGYSTNILSEVLGLSEHCKLYDVNQTLRSSTKSLDMGINLLSQSKSNEKALIIASDNRDKGEGDIESIYGDAACTIELGIDNVIAKVKGSVSLNRFAYDTWQLRSHHHLQQGDRKASSIEKNEALVAAAKKVLDECNENEQTIQWIIVTSDDLSQSIKVAKQLGFSGEKVIGNDIFQSIGYTGVSAPFLVLNEALLKANANDKILLMHYGSGADAFIFEVTKEVEQFKKNNPLQKLLEYKIEYDNYNHFHIQNGRKFRNGLVPFSTTIVEKRERMNNYQLLAQKCTSCGMIHFPARNNCSNCFQRDLEWIQLTRSGEVFTFTHDYLFPGENLATTMAVIDLDNGGRLFTQLTDYNISDVKVGLKVKLTFRKIHEGGNFPNYFWKATPWKEES